MTISFKTKAAGNANLDLVFDPYVQGTHPADTGLLADASLGGADIATRYAPIIYGSQAAATGLLTKQSGHADINTLFAAYGTAVYNLPINGNNYSALTVRSEAIIRFDMLNNGTYKISNQAGTVLDSGTWLPSGDSVSSYTCLFTTTLQNVSDPSGWYKEVITSASTQQPLTSSQYMYGGAAAVLSSNPITENIGSISMSLYRLGVLKFTTAIDVHVTSDPV